MYKTFMGKIIKMSKKIAENIQILNVQGYDLA